METKNLYDMIRDELWEKHSISALLFLLDGGRELNFLYKEKPYGIFRDNKKWFLSGENINEQQFDDAWSLLNNGVIEEKYIFELWNHIEIQILF